MNFPATQPFFGDPLNKLGNVECVQIEVIFSVSYSYLGVTTFEPQPNMKPSFSTSQLAFFLEGSTAQKLPVSREHPKV